MGTRNLTVVIHKSEVRMAQYGQWDGYLSGVGLDIAKVLKKTTVKALRKAIEKCSFISDAEVEKRWKACGSDSSFTARYPLLDRDNSGGRALALILKKGKSFELKNSLAFAADSLFCEWAYVIDLDEKVVEVYKGFNQKALGKKDRFFHLQVASFKEHRNKDQYSPIKILKKYKFKDFTPKALVALEEKVSEAAEAR